MEKGIEGDMGGGHGGWREGKLGEMENGGIEGEGRGGRTKWSGRK